MPSMKSFFFSFQLGWGSDHDSLIREILLSHVTFISFATSIVLKIPVISSCLEVAVEGEKDPATRTPIEVLPSEKATSELRNQWEKLSVLI